MKASTRDPRKSYIVNGKFRLPKLPPNCFGLAVHSQITAEQLADGIKAYGDDFTDTDGNPLAVGQRYECGQYTVRNKPYAPKYTPVGVNNIPKETDTAKLPGKPGSEERILALQSYYAKQNVDDNGGYSGESPFAITLEQVANNLAAVLANKFANYNKNDAE